MQATTTNIHPVFTRMLGREQREAKLGQRGRVIWLSGLSGSGKSTIAIALEQALFARNYYAQLLDGDNIRSGINKDLGFSAADRSENIRRIAEVAKLNCQSGLIVIASFISPLQAQRQLARSIIGEDDFIEVYINTPLAVCEARDVKGLYAKARRGEITQFTGIDAPYEAPQHPQLTIHTQHLTIEQASEQLLHYILPQITRS